MHEHKPEAGGELNEVGQELDALGARLSVRLGRQEEAVQAFRTATDAALEVSGEIFWLEDDRAEESRAKRATIDAARETYVAAARRFIVAAVELAGTRRPDTSSGTDEGTTAPETT
jgi:hypothetical protein